MSTLRLGIAVATLTLMSAAASAQVGVRIGGFGIGLGVPTQPLLHGRPDSGERYRAPQHTQRRHHNDDDDVKTAKRAPAAEDSKTENENSSIVSIAGDKDKPAKSDTAAFSSENSTIASASANITADADPAKGQLTPTTETDGSGKPVCKRFFPTVGQTISVPCE